MKNKLTALALAAVSASNAFAQFAMTNTATGELVTSHKGALCDSTSDISDFFNMRICVEDATLRLSEPFAFTNATLAHVFGAIMARHSNHVWSYESKITQTYRTADTRESKWEPIVEMRSDSIYVYPEDGAIMTLLCPPISVTNAVLRTLFKGDDVFGLKARGIQVFPTQGRGSSWWAYKKVSLETGEAPLWQVLYMIFDQIRIDVPYATDTKAWALRKAEPGAGRQYYLHRN